MRSWSKRTRPAAFAALLLLGLWPSAPTPASAAGLDSFYIVQTCGGRQLYSSALNGTMGYGTVDWFGNLCVPQSSGGGTSSVTQGTSPWVDNITQWAGTALGAPTTYGTAPSGNAPGVNAFVTNFPATQAVSWANQSVSVSNFPVTQPVSGTVAATQSGTWSVGVTNFPSVQGTNLAQWGGTAVAAATAYGTPPSGAVGGVNAFVTNFPTTQAVSWSGQTVAATQSGAWNTNLYLNGSPEGSGNPLFANVFYYDTSLSGPFSTANYAAPRVDRRGLAKTSETGSDDPLVGITANGGTGSTCSNGTATTGCVAKNAVGNLYRAYAMAPTAPATQQYLVCINATAVPAANATLTPVDFAAFNLATTAGATASINFAPGPPSAYSAGITCVVSTSPTTYTAGTASLVNTSVR